jgi:hypothetical protein
MDVVATAVTLTITLIHSRSNSMSESGQRQDAMICSALKEEWQ